jgi:uncharacterized protein (TIGR03083 family)
MTVFDDLEAEQDRLAAILAGLSGAQWARGSAAPGWTVRDVVVHLAQGEEMAVARLSGGRNPAAHDPARDPAQGQAGQDGQDGQDGRSVEQIMAGLVEADPATPAQALRRWQQARGSAMDLLRAADPQRRIEWAAAPLKPAAEVRAELTAPDGTSTWEFGPPDAASAITGDAGLFCRVAAQRLAPAQAAQAAGATGAGLRISGPDGARALALIRTYAV